MGAVLAGDKEKIVGFGRVKRRLQGRIDEAEPLHLESLAIRRESAWAFRSASFPMR